MANKQESGSDRVQGTQKEWFCLRAQNKREHIAAAILNQIDSVEAFCPRIRCFKKTRTGKKRFVEALFPGYLFARFNLADEYRRIIHTRGITYIVGHDDKRAVPDVIIERLQADLPDEGIIDAPDLSVLPGTEIEVLTGSLQGLRGKVLSLLPAEERVKVLLEILGREITVAVSAKDIHISILE
ncbi:MAG: transcription termination/antitermination protein NusG [Coraliomargaritaceae bacterium]